MRLSGGWRKIGCVSTQSDRFSGVPPKPPSGVGGAGGRDGNRGFIPGPAIPGLFAARRPIRFSSLDAKPELPYALAPEEFRGADRPLPVMIETRVSARDVHSARADGGENAPLRRAFAKPRSSRRRRDELPAPFGFGATILFHSGFSGDVGLSGVDRGRALHRGFQQTAQEDQR